MGGTYGEVDHIKVAPQTSGNAAAPRTHEQYSVVVGSGCSVELRAVEEALDSLGLVAVGIMSHEPIRFDALHPITYEELIRISRRRALDALLSRTGARFGIGIENGLITFPNVTYWLAATMVTIAGQDGRQFDVLGTQLPLPKGIASRCIRESETLSQLVQEFSSGAQTDPYAYFSRGLITHKNVIRDAVRAAYVPILNSDLYD